MPVDRSVSGIRVSGPAEKRRPAPRFPVQLPMSPATQMTHRRSSPRPDGAAWRRNSAGAAHRHTYKPRQVGRVRAQPTEADGTHRHSRPDTRTRNRTNRKPVRSLTIALLLAAATVAGVGVVAWAMGATPAPAAGVLGTGGSTDSSPVTGGPGNAENAASAVSTRPTDGRASEAMTTETSRAAALPGPAGSVQALSGSYGSPAMVSTLAPGDPGFGWPASAFGATS